jgi:fumarate reductase (CoM/CoB) subunit A
MIDIVKTDILIIGSGAAGLMAAVYAAKDQQNVLIIDKGANGKSGSTVGAVQIAALGPWSNVNDSREQYIRDTLESGRGLSDPSLVHTLAHDIKARVKDLIDWGFKPDRDENNDIILSPASGHSVPRSISTMKGKGGLGILQTLTRQAKKSPTIERWSDVITIQLLTSDGKAGGALIYDLRKNKLSIIRSKAVILATGGIGQLYPLTSNPVQATGDGFSLGLQAGALLIDMEQVQFYPVALASPTSLRGLCMSFYHMAKLYNHQGERFMSGYEPEDLENSTRDRLAYAVASEIQAGHGTANGGVWLNGKEVIEQIKQSFPHEYRLCKDRGLNLEEQEAEVAPSAHFMMGGIKIDTNASSTIAGLYVAGETAGGLHGGNRLGNNALSECLVFGTRAGISAANYAREVSSEHVIDFPEVNGIENQIKVAMTSTSGSVRPYKLKNEIRSILNEHVGVVRTTKQLKEAQEKLDCVKEQLPNMHITQFNNTYSREILDLFEVKHMVWTSMAIIGSALKRKESRGAHFMSDFPNALPNAEHTSVQYQEQHMIFKHIPLEGALLHEENPSKD